MKSSRSMSPGCTGASLIFISAIIVLLNDNRSIPHQAHPQLRSESKSDIAHLRECCIAPPGLPSTSQVGCQAERAGRRVSLPDAATEASARQPRATVAMPHGGTATPCHGHGTIESTKL